jgi:rod shape-determining protein MreC
MANKRVKVSNKMLFTWFMLAGFIFLFAFQDMTNEFQFAFARIFHLPLSIGRHVSLLVHTQHPLTDAVSRRKYNKLQNHLANVTQWLHQERQKVEKLSGLRERPIWKGANFVLADIITFSDGSNKLIINRGENDGLSKDQFVLGDNSIIGTISDADHRTARVTLVTDPVSEIAVRIAELNIDRLMQGSGNNSANIQLLPRKHEIKIDDPVYVCKKPGFLDTPMIVGTVAQCKEDNENPLLWDITVRPACDIKRLNSVAVVVMNPQE